MCAQDEVGKGELRLKQNIEIEEGEMGKGEVGKGEIGKGELGCPLEQSLINAVKAFHPGKISPRRRTGR